MQGFFRTFGLICVNFDAAFRLAVMFIPNLSVICHLFQLILSDVFQRSIYGIHHSCQQYEAMAFLDCAYLFIEFALYSNAQCTVLCQPCSIWLVFLFLGSWTLMVNFLSSMARLYGK